MRIVLPLAVSAFLLALAATPAGASGGIGCEVRDDTVTMQVGIGVTRGTGGFFNVDGQLDIARPDVPADLRSLALDDLLLHSWLDGEELKLQFYHERAEGDFATVGFVIETTQVEEGSYMGDYTLAIYGVPGLEGPEGGSWTASGKVDCIVE